MMRGVRPLARRLSTSCEGKAYAGAMTKVVCTLGPATETQERVQELCDAGMACARLNFSHVTDYSEPAAKMELVRAARGEHAKLEGTIHDAGSRHANLRAVLLDTKGPEVRTGTLPGNADSFIIEDGMEVCCTFDDVSGDEPVKAGDSKCRLHVDYESLPSTVSIGSKILLDDGLISLVVTSIGSDSVTAIAENSGPIKARKGVNLPGSILDLPALTPKDKEDIQWAVETGADFVALSFVRSARNVRSCRAFMERCCPDQKTRMPQIISKIENQEGVDNFDEILEASDGVMVARGDLGVEIDFEKVFAAQRYMVDACNRVGKPVIVATQMLDSMMRQPRPTRAEVTDVAAAVLDGADAVMLSGETAAGKYPIESLQAMKSIIREADAIIDGKSREGETSGKSYARSAQKSANVVPLQDVELDAVARAACRAADALDAKLITCVTRSGQLAKAVARHRPSIPIVAFCYTAEVGRSLALHRAVTPILLDAGAELRGNQPVCRLHAIEQASRRWRAGRRDDSARTCRNI
jgi:pyruvate kinase